MDLKVGLLGGGSWGTTVASLTARNTPTTLWARNKDTVAEINKKGTNERYLPGRQLTPSLRATDSIQAVARDADVIVMGIPSQNFRNVLQQARPYIRPWVPIISLSKGLERGTQQRMTQIIEEEMPGHPAGALSGPNLAREIMDGYAAAAVIAMVDDTIANVLKDLFSTGLFRVYTNTDVIGVELGGALKNVIAIAAGMGDGVGAGTNTRSAVITRGLFELTQLGVAMGGRPETFAGLAGMGDLIATCTSPLSRNRTVGFNLGQGKKLDEIIDEMSMVAEGVKTCSVVMELGKKYGLTMPIVNAVAGVLYENKTVMDAYRGLVKAGTGSEAEPG